jgi:hypothetical protein
LMSRDIGVSPFLYSAKNLPGAWSLPYTQFEAA